MTKPSFSAPKLMPRPQISQALERPSFKMPTMPSVASLSDKFNPLDKNFVRADGQKNIYNSVVHSYKPQSDSLYTKYAAPTVNKVPGFVQDFSPDKKIDLNSYAKNTGLTMVNPVAGLSDIMSYSKSGRDMKRGVGEFFASSPQWIGGVAKSQMEKDATRIPIIPGLSNLTNIGMMKNPMVSDDAREAMQKSKEPMVNWVTDKQKANANWVANSDLARQESSNDLAKQVGSGGASLATAAGLTAVTGSTAPASILFGAMSKGRTYDEARAAGSSVEKADTISTAAGVTEGLLEKVGLDFFFKKFGTGSGISNFVANSLIKSGSEAMQEGSQELGTNFWAKVGYDKERALTEGVFDSMFIGGLMGLAGGGSASSMDQNLYQNARKAGLSKEQASTFVDVMADKIAGAVDKTGQYIKDNPPGLTTKDVNDDGSPRNMGDFLDRDNAPIEPVAPTTPPVGPVSPQGPISGVQPTEPGYELLERMKNAGTAQTNALRDETIAGNRESKRLINQDILDQFNEYHKTQYKPTDSVTVYRAGNGSINDGDQVTTSEENAKKYAGLRDGSQITKSKVKLKDLVRNEGIGNEFIFNPQKKAKAVAAVEYREVPNGIELWSNGNRIGVSEIEMNGSNAVIPGIEVNPEYQNKGYGTKLLQKTEELAKNKGAKNIVAQDVMTPEFFDKNGYVKDDTTSVSSMVKNLTKSEPSKVGKVDTFKFQDANQEKIVKRWDSWETPGLDKPQPGGYGASSLRETLEGTGDIFRETTGASPGGRIDLSYITEKINRLDELIKSPNRMADYADNKKILSELRDAWTKQPTNTAQEKLAKELNIALIDGDFAKVKKLRDTLASSKVGKVDVAKDTSSPESVVNPYSKQTAGDYYKKWGKSDSGQRFIADGKKITSQIADIKNGKHIIASGENSGYRMYITDFRGGLMGAPTIFVQDKKTGEMASEMFWMKDKEQSFDISDEMWAKMPETMKAEKEIEFKLENFYQDNETTARQFKGLVDDNKFNIALAEIDSGKAKPSPKAKSIVERVTEKPKGNADTGMIVKTAAEQIEENGKDITEQNPIVERLNDKTKVQATPEYKKETKEKIGKATEKEAKERGLITSFKASDKVHEDLKEILAGEYTPKENDDLYSKAKFRVQKDYQAAIEFAKENATDEAFATGYAVIERAMKSGDKKTAGDVAIRMAENATTAGQAVQALAMLNRMTPEGLVAFIERKVNKYNNDQKTKKFKIGKEKNVELNDDQRQYFFDTAAKIQKMEDGVDKDVARFLLLQEADDLFPNTGREKAANFWRAGLLTGTTTHLLNMVSTGSNLTAEQATRLVAAPLDMIASLISGKRTTSATFKGYGKGFKKGLGEAALYLKTGFDRERMAARYDYKHTTYDTKAGKVAGKASEYVYRLLGAEDKLFWNSALQNSLYEQADVEAKNKKLRGQEKVDYVNDRVANPSNALLLKAQEQADIAAFHNKTRLGEAAKKFQSIPGMEFVVPFTNTPAAVAIQIAKYTPGTAVFTMADEIVKAMNGNGINQRRLVTAVSRNVVGAVPFLVGAMLMGGKDDDDKEKNITMGYPMADKKKQAQWELEGKKEYSIRLGDKWYQLQAFGPAGMVMALGARYKDGRENGLTAPQAMANSYLAMADLVKSQSFLEGVEGLFRATQYMDDYTDIGGAASNYVQGQVASFIPAIVNEIANTIDPMEREAKTFPEKLAARIPGIRQMTLEAKRDVLGNPIERRTDRLNYVLNPARPSDVRNEDNATVMELNRLMNKGQAVSLTRENGKVTIGEDKFKLSGKELGQLKEKIGGAISPELQSLVNSQGYAALDDAQKKSVIDDVISNNKKPATVQFMSDKGKIDQTKFDTAVSEMESGQKATVYGGGTGSSGSLKSVNDKVDKMNFEKSGKNYMVIGDKVYRRNAEGNVISQPKYKFDYQVGQAKLAQYKLNDDVKGWMTAASGQLASIEKQLQDPSIDPLDSIQLQNDYESLVDKMEQYKEYGGFKKGKSSSAKRTKLLSDFKTSQANISGTELDTYKFLQSLLSGTRKSTNRKVALKAIPGAKK